MIACVISLMLPWSLMIATAGVKKIIFVNVLSGASGRFVERLEERSDLVLGFFPFSIFTFLMRSDDVPGSERVIPLPDSAGRTECDHLEVEGVDVEVEMICWLIASKSTSIILFTEGAFHDAADPS